MTSLNEDFKSLEKEKNALEVKLASMMDTEALRITELSNKLLELQVILTLALVRFVRYI